MSIDDCTIANGKCSLGASCQDIDTGCSNILGNAMCCEWQRMKAVTEAVFNPIATLQLFYRRAIEFLRGILTAEMYIVEVAAGIAAVGLFLYIASWIGSLVAFFNLFF